MPPHKALNPAAELLRTSARVRGWHPTHGKLKLTLAELQDAAPALVRMLKEDAAGGGGLVLYKRPYVHGSGGHQKHPKLHFVFDTPMLMKLLHQQQQ